MNMRPLDDRIIVTREGDGPGVIDGRSERTASATSGIADDSREDQINQRNRAS
jgi:hypothetical protein